MITLSIKRLSQDLLSECERDAALLLFGEQEDDKVVASLPLPDWGVQREHKEHLPLVVVWQQEKPRDCAIRDLVVKSLAMQL